MLEQKGDLWELPADARCITTNGVVNRSGEAVMGRGCALQAKQRHPWLARELARRIAVAGNVVHLVGGSADGPLVTFPVKHRWAEPADLSLIERSCGQLMELVGRQGWHRVLLPRPGCGNGQLDWEWVKLTIAPLLDDRVVVIDK